MEKLQILGRNIKVLAEGINPGIITEYYLKVNNVINENVIIKPNSITTPQFVQLISDDFVLMILPDNFQFNIINNEDQGCKSFERLIEVLSFLQFRAIGFNYDFLINDTQDLGKKLFYKPECYLFNEFNGETSRFGGFLMKEYDGSILSLNIRPNFEILVNTQNNSFLQFSFNFHTEISSDNPHELIKNKINNFVNYFDYAHSIMRNIYND